MDRIFRLSEKNRSAISISGEDFDEAEAEKTFKQKHNYPF